MGINLTTNYSINFTNEKRHKKLIKFIIIHYTGMKNDRSALKRLCEAKSKVSAHYFLKRSGEILNFKDRFIHRESLGFKTSRKRSPTTFIEKTVSNKRSPGYKLIQYLPDNILL